MLRFISLLLVSGGGPNRVERVLDLFGTLMLHCPGRVSDNGSWSVRLSLACYLDERPTGGRRLILTTQSLRRGHPLAFSFPLSLWTLSNSDWGAFHFQIHSNQANDAIISLTACCSFFNLVVFWLIETIVSIFGFCGHFSLLVSIWKGRKKQVKDTPYLCSGRDLTVIIIVSLGCPLVLSRATLGSLTPAGSVSRVLLFCHMPGKHRKPINILSKAFKGPWHRLNLKKRTMMKSTESTERDWGGRGRVEVFILTHSDVLNRLQRSC